MIKYQDFPEVEAACIYHYGSYQDFPKTYEKILKFIEMNNYEICGHIREKYMMVSGTKIHRRIGFHKFRFN